jgi:hypothetical protein
VGKAVRSGGERRWRKEGRRRRGAEGKGASRCGMEGGRETRWRRGGTGRNETTWGGVGRGGGNAEVRKGEAREGWDLVEVNEREGKGHSVWRCEKGGGEGRRGEELLLTGNAEKLG